MRRDSDTKTKTGDTTAHNIHAGRDFTQINKSITQPTPLEQRSPPSKKPPTDSWLQLFTFLLKPSPVTIPRLNTVFRTSFLGSIAVLLGILTAVIPNYTPLFSAGYPLAPSTFFPIVLMASLVAIVSKEYFLTRESTTYPACEAPFSLITTDYPEKPAISTNSPDYGTRDRLTARTVTTAIHKPFPGQNPPGHAELTPRPNDCALLSSLLRKESRIPQPIT